MSRTVAQNRAYLKRRRLMMARGEWTGLTPSIGAQRRLQALARLGWSWAHIAAESGYTERAIQRFATTPRPTMQPRTAQRIADVFNRLSMRPGPSIRAALWAARRGWPAPLAWDDDDLDNPSARPYFDDINHGTRGGYVTHRNRGQQPCQACFEADRAYQRARLRRAA